MSKFKKEKEWNSFFFKLLNWNLEGEQNEISIYVNCSKAKHWSIEIGSVQRKFFSVQNKIHFFSVKLFVSMKSKAVSSERCKHYKLFCFCFYSYWKFIFLFTFILLFSISFFEKPKGKFEKGKGLEKGMKRWCWKTK